MFERLKTTDLESEDVHKHKIESESKVETKNDDGNTENDSNEDDSTSKPAKKKSFWPFRRK
ncbi:hypothetical protein U8527_09010 [Kordia algicida OT-1]|uniref:Uncharacterized protein n=1 Tax=Kordia algicida OT-1 TaxID=391587 RepID=A9DTY3_9FLAO|nr:hypothetical protein [Kordia algicida]EDP96238.1 hypothetical protein KAOT1_02477 [Kordia algicida OT-1]